MKELLAILVASVVHQTTDVYFTGCTVFCLVGRPVLKPVSRWYIKGISKVVGVPNMWVEPTRREVLGTLEDHRDMAHAAIDGLVASIRKDDRLAAAAEEQFKKVSESVMERTTQQMERIVN